jgi:hypothetical protein
MVEASGSSLVLDLTAGTSSLYWIPESRRDRELQAEYILGDIIGR